MAVIGIKYSGGNTYDDDDNLIEDPVIYECVTLYLNDENLEFASGNFVKDWWDAKKKFADDSKEYEPFSQSSSVHHFIMDGAKFDSAYLHKVEGEMVLQYVDRSKPDWYLGNESNGWEFFVTEGTTPTWEEFKELIR